jgi:phage I-like protein
VAVIQTAHFLAISADPSSLPSEFRLFSYGKNETSKGTFVLDPAGLDSVMRAYADHGVELAIDYEHQTFAAADNGKPAPAAGWFVPEARADGLWAVNVRWTDAAAEMLRGKEYRYFSPTFEVDKDNRITRLLPVALTNFPATKNQTPLIAARDIAATEIRMSNAVNKILSLKDEAGDDEVEARVVSLARTEAELLKTTGADNVGDAIATVIAQKDAAVKLAAAEKSLREWQEADERAKQFEREKEIAKIVDQAIFDGRVSLKDTDKITTLKSLGEVHGIPALKTAVGLMTARPVRVYQAPVFENTDEARLKALRDYQKLHPNMSTADAYVALAAERPALFDGGR